jgi:hypothetical protein
MTKTCRDCLFRLKTPSCRATALPKGIQFWNSDKALITDHIIHIIHSVETQRSGLFTPPGCTVIQRQI